ncbi:hypothetical protein SARC_07653 [Sphaeroforma arctica JP610]|uniref:Cytochrome c peroxidase, mitochondrial n=1 Tax=Sphaeroforma arctica JP610 TaxID=667725 RepID=A0A0L0FT43_9EUKA|nr:hypothetical protein SARC_07653 [Sphaeroforma arctica JP610]KNC79970.1 hypothetical protein SARC_07653 [Sphaeroforma arctica JP610]|eukprot:XP_014153872.1 hypothetical protein SARC_07653 [Sphaeroforma arctica JP610]
MTGTMRLKIVLILCCISAISGNDIYNQAWYSKLDSSKQAHYDNLTDDITSFLNGGDDSHRHDEYRGFGPVLLRTSFHAAGTFDHKFNKGGINGGTLQHNKVLEKSGNACIDIATDVIKVFARRNKISFADTTAIAGALALKSMDFPRMDLISVKGGRFDLDASHAGGPSDLPNAQVNPLQKFTDEYGFSTAEFVALIGGAHSLGAAHAVCTCYAGSFSDRPLSWAGPDFFRDLVDEEWTWYTLTTFDDDTITFTIGSEPDWPTGRGKREIQ